MSAAGPRLLVAITGHGFGHATRTAAVARALLELVPGLRLTIRSTVPARLLELGELASRLDVRAASYEPGVVQQSCFDVGWDATRRAYTEWLRARPARLDEELQVLRAGGHRGVLADIPALPLAAAAELELPAAALWNFTWDWILEEQLAAGLPGVSAELARLPALLRADYACAGLHLRLPFSPRDTSLSGVEDVPLIGRRSTRSREETRAKLGLGAKDTEPLVLISMGGWSCAGWQPIAVKGGEAFRFLVAGDVPVVSRGPILALPPTDDPGSRFCDYIAAADLVISKPGYGICSECVVNRTPLLAVERRGFREVQELLRGMPAHGPFAEMSLDDFFAGRWEPAMTRLLGARPVWKPIDEDASVTIAKRLARHFAL